MSRKVCAWVTRRVRGKLAGVVMRVAHVITRMIVGGAQENTLLNCEDLVQLYGDDVLLITGPALGPEGNLLTQGRGVSFQVQVVPELRRDVHPWRDWVSYRAVRQHLRVFRPEVVHTHSAKGGLLGRLAAWSLRVPAIIHTVHGGRRFIPISRGGRGNFSGGPNGTALASAMRW